MTPLRPLAVLRPRWLLVGALACAVAAGALAFAPGGAPPPVAHVLVAREAIPAGTLLDADDVAGRLVTVPVPDGLPLTGLVADPAAAGGRRTVGPLAPGEPLTEAVLGGGPGAVAPLAPGERAVPVPALAAGGAASALAPGVRVDVVASTGEGFAGRTEVVVGDAEVLAVDPGLGSAVDAAQAPSVLLRATPADALRITSALNFARDVRLLVRPPEEQGGAPPAPVRVAP